jgi:uncharacterized protein (TIGR02145 family)
MKQWMMLFLLLLNYAVTRSQINPKIEMISMEGRPSNAGSISNTSSFNSTYETALAPFLISKYEIYESQWKSLMGDSQFKWRLATDFIRKFSVLSGKNYRLPTEEELEYVRRSGKENYNNSTEKTIAGFRIVEPTFSLVRVWNQEWFSKNLDVTKFRNGDEIPEAKTEQQWIEAGEKKQPAWCYYNNDIKKGAVFGKLYNYYAVKDPRGLAPIGFHIPELDEWGELNQYLGSSYATKIKSPILWPPNCNGNNETGFNGLPSGNRDINGNFSGVTSASSWWSSSEFDEFIDGSMGVLFFGIEDCDNPSSRWYLDPREGHPVRCVKDQNKYESETSELKFRVDSLTKELALLKLLTKSNGQILQNSMSTEFKEPELVFVQGGTFQMGNSNGDKDEAPVHEVYLSSFYIGKYEVTEHEWQDVMGLEPSPNCYNCPVVNVSWMEVQEYIKRINMLTGKQYRLPTEAEWEYAAKGGTLTKENSFNETLDIDDVAFYNHDVGTWKVGSKKSNQLGIFDMCGNAWEWCNDWYKGYSSSKESNPLGSNSGDFRIIRGGGWNSTAYYCRTTHRSGALPQDKDHTIGFRLVLTSDTSQRSAK